MPINHRLRHFLFFFAGVAAGFIVGKMIVAVGSAADVSDLVRLCAMNTQRL